MWFDPTVIEGTGFSGPVPSPFSHPWKSDTISSPSREIQMFWSIVFIAGGFAAGYFFRKSMNPGETFADAAKRYFNLQG